MPGLAAAVNKLPALKPFEQREGVMPEPKVNPRGTMAE